MKRFFTGKIKNMAFFKQEEDDFIKNNYTTVPAKRISKLLGRNEGATRQRMKILGLTVPPEIIEKFKKDSLIKPGNIPANKGKKQSDFMSAEAIENSKKTRFKKGQLPHNAIGFKDGDIVVRHSHKRRNSPPYKWIRIALGKWRMLHVIKWEKENGSIPNGFIVVFKNKDTMNCEVNNLELITKKENMIRNTIHRYPDDLKTTIRKLSKLNKKIKHAEEQNQ